MKDTFFHGTIENFDGPLKPSSYDNLLWTADNPAIAQTYIPDAGSKLIVHNPKYQRYNLDDNVNQFDGEHDNKIKVLKQMGYGYPVDAEIENGRYRSYRYHKKPAKWKELLEYLKSLGYDEEEAYWKIKYDSDSILPAGYKAPGKLFMGHKDDAPLNIYDYSKHGDGDLQDPDYHKLHIFDKIKKEGYDGIKINDFAQTPNWGNVSHTSTGLFPETINRLNWESIPVQSFDFDKLVGEFTTPEFEQWRHR